MDKAQTFNTGDSVEISRGSFGTLVKHALKGIKNALSIESASNYRSAVGAWRETSAFIAYRKRWYTKVLFALSLWPVCMVWSVVMIMMTISSPLLIPLGFTVVVGACLITIDQLTYPVSEVDPIFFNKKNAELTVDQKGGMLFTAAYHQIELELDSTLGWCPNDLATWPPKHLDNRCSRQKGVWYATKRAGVMLSERLTKFGTGDKENEDTKNAHMHMGNFPDQWGGMGIFQDASERHFRSAIEDIKKFVSDSRKSRSTKDDGILVNVRTDDLVFLMAMLVADGGILTEPYGNLSSRNREVTYFEIDDDVYYAQGAAIVARDIAVAMRWMYADELSRGGLNNLDAAIDALNAAAKYNPAWISQGDSEKWWSQKLADDRAKMQNYFTIAFRRIEDLKESLKS